MAFEIDFGEDGVIDMVGRCDASQAPVLEAFLAGVDTSAVIDMSLLTYISSSGLGYLFAAQRRLLDSGHALTLRHLTPHIREVFDIAGFNAVFEIEEG